MMPADRTNPEEIRTALLASAKKLFFEYGIIGTEMKAVAEHAGVSRSTLYRYVLDRNQLAFMVSTEVFAELTDKCMAVAVGPNLTGYQKLEQYVHHVITTLCGSIPLVNYISEFDSLFKNEYPEIPEAVEYADAMRRTMHRVGRFMSEGLADGSVRRMDDPALYVAVLMNTIFGLVERMLPREMHYQEEQGVSAMDVTVAAADILLESIKRGAADAADRKKGKGDF